MLKNLVKLAILPILSLDLYAITSHEVIELKKSGIDDETIIQAAQSDDDGFIYSVKDLTELKKNNISNELIKKLIQTKKEKRIEPIVAPEITTKQPEPAVAPKIMAGQVEIVVHTCLGGAKLLIDGKHIADLNSGANKIKAPTGTHWLEIHHNDMKYKKEVVIDPGEANAFDIYNNYTSDDENKKLYDEYLKKFNSPNLTYMFEPIPTPIYDNVGQQIGKYDYATKSPSLVHGIKCFDKKFIRVLYIGGKEKISYTGEPAINIGAERLFLVDFDEELNEVNSVIYNDKAYLKYKEIFTNYHQADLVVQQIKEYEKSGTAKNVAVVFSDKAKGDTTEFKVRIENSDTIYDFAKDIKLYTIKPDIKFHYLWIRKGLKLRAEGNFTIPSDKNTIFVIHSNFLGNQTKTIHVSKDINLDNITYAEVKKYE